MYDSSFRLSPAEAAAMLALIVLSAFVAAMVGLFVGRISEGMMAGVVYIKIVMIVFMAILAVHCAVWFLFYLFISRCRRKRLF